VRPTAPNEGTKAKQRLMRFRMKFETSLAALETVGVAKV
jgi:hypothetical protein